MSQIMQNHQSRVILILTACILSAGGCQPNRTSSSSETLGSHPIRADRQSDPVEAAADQPAAAESVVPADSHHTVDAMVGQINGRPVYAGEVFASMNEEQLERRGATTPPSQFRRELSRELTEQLVARIQNELVIAEAEAGLTEHQQIGLLGIIKMEREKLIARFGGALALAADGVRQQYGMSIDEFLERRRQEILLDKYLREKLWPNIHVTRRHVEHYYQVHYDEFNPPPRVTLRLITTDDAPNAEEVDAALRDGEDFAEVAGRYSTFRAADGGLIEATSTLKGFSALRWDAVNEAVRELSPGDRSERLMLGDGYAWVYLESVDANESRSLAEAYLEIEQLLKVQRFNQLSQQYMADLMRQGNYTPLEQMRDGLLAVAMSRYAQTE
jgi:hypothetical protein